VADACLAERPDLRHLRDAQERIDTAHRIGDEQYLQMCRGEEVHRIAERLGAAAFLWTAGGPMPSRHESGTSSVRAHAAPRTYALVED
jgi:hypothetical protein